MVSRKLQLSELKNWMPKHSRERKKKVHVGVELRAGGDPQRSEKPGWSAGDMRQWPKQKNGRYPVSPTAVLLLVFLTCSKSAKILRSSHPRSSHLKEQSSQPSQRAVILEAK